MTTLRKALADGNLETFIAEREAEGAPDSDADKLANLTRRLSETSKSVKRISKTAPTGD
ncbi:MAG: hypothetical protein ACOYLS_15885 [Polymorphobacter sp.]